MLDGKSDTSGGRSELCLASVTSTSESTHAPDPNDRDHLKACMGLATGVAPDPHQRPRQAGQAIESGP